MSAYYSVPILSVHAIYTAAHPTPPPPKSCPDTCRTIYVSRELRYLRPRLIGGCYICDGPLILTDRLLLARAGKPILLALCYRRRPRTKNPNSRSSVLPDLARRATCTPSEMQGHGTDVRSRSLVPSHHSIQQRQCDESTCPRNDGIFLEWPAHGYEVGEARCEGSCWNHLNGTPPSRNRSRGTVCHVHRRRTPLTHDLQLPGPHVRGTRSTGS